MRQLLGLLLFLLALGAAQRATTLARIEADPEAYFGREVVLVGYLWPWFKPAPLVCRGLPLARGNQAKTRSDGNFCDGTRIVFLPPGLVPGFDPERDLGVPLELVARVEPAPGGWRLVPIRLLRAGAP